MISWFSYSFQDEAGTISPQHSFSQKNWTGIWVVCPFMELSVTGCSIIFLRDNLYFPSLHFSISFPLFFLVLVNVWGWTKGRSYLHFPSWHLFQKAWVPPGNCDGVLEYETRERIVLRRTRRISIRLKRNSSDLEQERCLKAWRATDPYSLHPDSTRRAGQF